MEKLHLLANQCCPESSCKEYCYSVKKEITYLCQLPILPSAYNGARIWVHDDSLLQQHSLLIATGYCQLTVGTS